MHDELTIRAHDLTVIRGHATLLHPTSLTLPCGRLVAILGRNGAGKSTLLTALSGLRPPTRGHVQYGAHEVRHCTPAMLARLRAYMPQDTHIAFGYRVRDIVELGRIAHAGTSECRNDAVAVAHALAAFDLAGLSARLATTLSGGERQRMRMARLAAQLFERLEAGAPAWLLLDEATAALDVDQQHRLMARLRRYADQGCGVVLVLHDLALAALYADTVVVIENGRVVEHGPPDAVLSPSTVRARFGIDVSAVRMTASTHSLYPHPRQAA